MLEHSPDDDALKRFSSRHPDRWAHTVSLLAKLAGYSDKEAGKIADNILIQINNLGDAELEEMLQGMQQRLIDLMQAEGSGAQTGEDGSSSPHILLEG